MAGASRWLDPNAGAASARSGRNASSQSRRALRTRESFMSDLLLLWPKEPLRLAGTDQPPRRIQVRALAGGIKRAENAQDLASSDEPETGRSRPRSDAPGRGPGIG